MQRQIASLRDLGELIRSERRRQGLTLSNLSGLTTVSVRTISEIERGQPRKQIGLILELLTALGIELVAETSDEPT